MAIIDVVTPAEKERRRLMALIEQRDRLRGGAVSPPSPASPPSPPQQPFDPSQEGVSMAPSAPPVPGGAPIPPGLGGAPQQPFAPDLRDYREQHQGWPYYAGGRRGLGESFIPAAQPAPIPGPIGDLPDAPAAPPLIQRRGTERRLTLDKPPAIVEEVLANFQRNVDKIPTAVVDSAELRFSKVLPDRAEPGTATPEQFVNPTKQLQQLRSLHPVLRVTAEAGMIVMGDPGPGLDPQRDFSDAGKRLGFAFILAEILTSFAIEGAYKPVAKGLIAATARRGAAQAVRGVDEAEEAARLFRRGGSQEQQADLIERLGGTPSEAGEAAGKRMEDALLQEVDVAPAAARGVQDEATLSAVERLRGVAEEFPDVPPVQQRTVNEILEKGGYREPLDSLEMIEKQERTASSRLRNLANEFDANEGPRIDDYGPQGVEDYLDEMGMLDEPFPRHANGDIDIPATGRMLRNQAEEIDQGIGWRLDTAEATQLQRREDAMERGLKAFEAEDAAAVEADLLKKGGYTKPVTWDDPVAVRRQEKQVSSTMRSVAKEIETGEGDRLDTFGWDGIEENLNVELPRKPGTNQIDEAAAARFLREEADTNDQLADARVKRLEEKDAQAREEAMERGRKAGEVAPEFIEDVGLGPRRTQGRGRGLTGGGGGVRRAGDEGPDGSDQEFMDLLDESEMPGPAAGFREAAPVVEDPAGRGFASALVAQYQYPRGRVSSPAPHYEVLAQAEGRTGFQSKNILNLTDIPVGLDRSKWLDNILRRGANILRRTVPHHEQSTPIMQERARINARILSQANVVAEKHHASLHNVFSIDDQQLIPALAGIDPSIPLAPSVQDVAARLPRFTRYLTQGQLAALEELRVDLAPWRQLLDDFEIETGVRRDIMEGGFYIHRGASRDVSEEVEAFIRGRASVGGGERSFQKTEKLTSMGQGVQDGRVYAPLGDSLRNYIHQVGELSRDSHIARQFKALKDPYGASLAVTKADMVPVALRQKVTRLRNNIRQATKAMGQQEVRGGVLGQELARRTREAEAAAGRTTRRAPGAQGAISKEDFRRLQKTLKEAEAHKASVLDDMRFQVEAMRAAKKQLTAADRKIIALMDRLAKDVEGDELLAKIAQDPAEAWDADYILASIRIESVNAQIDELIPGHMALAETVDELTFAGNLLAGVRKASQIDVLNGRKALRAAQNKDWQVALAQRELTLLELEESRRLASQTAAQRRFLRNDIFQGRAALRRQKFQSELDEVSDAWQDALHGNPEGTIIQLPGLEGSFFPQAVADAANEVIRRTGQLQGEASFPLEAIRDINQLYLGIRATADNSYGFIQGSVGMYANQAAFARAARVNGVVPGFGAWRDPKVLGAFIKDYDHWATKQGRLTAVEWAGEELRVGGSMTEFFLGGGLFKQFEKIPGVTKIADASNRAFGSFGDALRLGWADDLLAEELAKGRNLAEIRASGDLGRIAEVANNMTGFSKHAVLGSMGDVVLLAPKYFASRFQTLGRGAMGLLPGASIDKRIARRSLLRMIGYGAALTEAINFATGNETDRRPVIKNARGEWRYNSNFYRVRFLGRDYSLFGPWDSMLRLLVTAGIAAETRSIPTAFDAVRGMTSGVANNTWDFVSGEDFNGKRTRDNSQQIARRLASNFVPFSAEQGTETAEQLYRDIRDKNLKGVAGGVLGLAAEFEGIKSAPLSMTDIAQSLADEWVATQPLEEQAQYEGKAYFQLPVRARDEIYKNDEVKRLQEKMPDTLPSIKEQVAVSMENFRHSKADSVEKLERRVRAGSRGKELTDAIQTYKSDVWNKSQDAFGRDNIIDYLNKTEPGNLEDMFREAYWSAQLTIVNQQTGELSYDARDKVRKQILERADDEGVDRELITNRRPTQNTMVDEVLASYDRDQEALRPLWEVPESVLQDFPPGQNRDTLLDYLAADSTDRVSYRDAYPMLIKAFDAEVSRVRKNYRGLFPDIGAIYLKRGYSDIPVGESPEEVAGLEERRRTGPNPLPAPLARPQSFAPIQPAQRGLQRER